MTQLHEDGAARDRDWIGAALRWEASYELSGVDRFVADADAQRESLAAQIRATRDRIERARVAAANREVAERKLAARILEAERELRAVEQEHAHEVAAIARAAEQEAGRILAAAEEEAAALRAATSVARRQHRGGSFTLPPGGRLVAVLPVPAGFERHDP